MKKSVFLFVNLCLAATISTVAGLEESNQSASATGSKGENSIDLFSAETNYTLGSDFHNESRLGHGDSFYSDFSYDHRFLITGKWYFRAGVEYERYDFGGTDNGLPDHLQAAYGHVALEYVVHDFPGVFLELDPGVYFQDSISGDAFDIPWKTFVAFPLKKDKIFGLIGLGGALYQDPGNRSRRRSHLANLRQIAAARRVPEAGPGLSAKRRLGLKTHRRIDLRKLPNR